MSERTGSIYANEKVPEGYIIALKQAVTDKIWSAFHVHDGWSRN